MKSAFRRKAFGISSRQGGKTGVGVKDEGKTRRRTRELDKGLDKGSNLLKGVGQGVKSFKMTNIPTAGIGIGVTP